MLVKGYLWVKGRVSLSLSLSAKTVITGSTLTVEGFLTPLPVNSFPENGLTVFLNIINPEEEDILLPVQIGSSGQYESPPLDIFSLPGIWTVRAVFEGSDNYLSDITEAQTLEVFLPEETGYAIIVQGKISSEEGITSHKKSVETIYDILAEREIRPENIKAFGYDLSEDIEYDVPIKENIEQALSPWAVSRINEVSASLYIILIGSCGSGSFIADTSGPDRVIITSSAKAENAYRGPLEDNNKREGSYFLSEFFKLADRGNSIEESFDLAVSQIKTWPEDKSIRNVYKYGFNDNAPQHPLIDDNGDGEGQNYISPVEGEYGSTPLYKFLGTSAPDVQLEFLSVSPRIIIEPTDGLMLDNFWIEIKASDYNPLYTTQYEKKNDFTRIVYDLENIECNKFFFDAYGDYDFKRPRAHEIYYFAKDFDSQRTLPFYKSVVYRKLIFNFSPGGFNLVSPADESTQAGTIVLLDGESALFWNWGRI